MEAPSPSRDIVIGDVHGCLDEFRDLVDKVGPTSSDRVICLCDFMDKGREPAACVRFARESGFEAVLGNHEERHLKWRNREARAKADPKFKNTMRPFGPRALEQNALLSDEDIAWLQGLPHFLRFAPNWVAVHGGVLPGAPVEQQDPEDILRMRWVKLRPDGVTWKAVSSDPDHPSKRPEGAFHWTEVYDGADNVVVGHEAHSLDHPVVRKGRGAGSSYSIDTACVHGGHLSALVLSGGEVSFVTVKARQVYDVHSFPTP